MMWIDRQHPDVIFGDCRYETIIVPDRSHGRLDGTRTLNICPDIALDFRELPFTDSSFNLVMFDPPHLVRAGKRSWLSAKYGVLRKHWKDDLRKGFAECFRVLHQDGTLIFKWSEVQIAKRDAIACAPFPPLIVHAAKTKTHWAVFMKPRQSNLSATADISGA
jgi:hypothetical protein